ncbi:Grx4 family monothiol glutaredoxin [Algiphilus sp.]|uniref:Grx4 family monothiol glutaredoxin n=1 Tax=Algiphilus sp. TaxID=1872431 RepID=UPI003B516E2A
MDAHERIRKQLAENPVLLYMKGTPDFPQCGFSARAVAALNGCGVPFAFVNVYENEDIYHALPEYANWPTFPQLFVKGEFVGGCDITLDLYEQGDLQRMLEEAVTRPK